MFNGTNHEFNKTFTEFLAASVLLWVRVTPLRLVGTPPPTAEWRPCFWELTIVSIEWLRTRIARWVNDIKKEGITETAWRNESMLYDRCESIPWWTPVFLHVLRSPSSLHLHWEVVPASTVCACVAHYEGYLEVPSVFSPITQTQWYKHKVSLQLKCLIGKPTNKDFVSGHVNFNKSTICRY